MKTEAKATRELTPQQLADIRAVTFFTETVCHLNPTRMHGQLVRDYLEVCARLRQEVLAAAEGVAEVTDG